MGYYPRTENDSYNKSFEESIRYNKEALEKVENMIEQRSSTDGFRCSNPQAAQEVANRLNSEGHFGKTYIADGNRVIEGSVDQGLFDKDGYGSMGKASGNANYIKKFSDGSLLSVHAPKGVITGAKYKIDGEEEILNNYQAAMHDLRDGEVKKNTGGEW
ncbi:MAG: hypothetical protein ACOCUR_01910 [Nanoarchaeota archaeon]